MARFETKTRTQGNVRGLDRHVDAAGEQRRVARLLSRIQTRRSGVWCGCVEDRYPRLNIRTAHGYFDASSSSNENNLLLLSIRDYHPHLLLVGMGMPRQEHWVLDNLDKIDANAILVCGAAMDYVAGSVRTPPRWTGRMGVEWFFRLCHEPTRLWRRYLIEPWSIIGMLCTRSHSRNLTSKIEDACRDRQIPGD